MALVLLLYLPLVGLVHLVQLVPVCLLLLEDLLVLALDPRHDRLPLLGDLLLKVVLRQELVELLQNRLWRKV